MTKRLFYSFAVILFAAASLSAQPPITADIPFPFHMGDSILPPGTYTTNMHIAGGAVLALRSDDGKSFRLAMTNAVHSSAGPAKPAFVFNKYGDEYFLSQIWTGAGEGGRELVKSRRENGLAAATKHGIETVLATR
jgi:hypothetical protein